MRLAIGAALFCLPALAFAQSSSTPRIIGLSSASEASFTMSPGGCALTLLFNRLSVAWNNGGQPPRRMPEARFNLVGNAASHGRTVSVQMRGFVQGRASVRLDAGGQGRSFDAQGEEFLIRTSARLARSTSGTGFRLALDLPEPSQGEPATLTLDSIDITLPGCR